MLLCLGGSIIESPRSFVFLKKNIVIDVDGTSLKCSTDSGEDGDLLARMTYSVLESVVSGRMSFQRAFMMGDIKTKGDLNTIRKLDELFVFQKN